MCSGCMVRVHHSLKPNKLRFLQTRCSSLTCNQRAHLFKDTEEDSVLPSGEQRLTFPIILNYKNSQRHFLVQDRGLEKRAEMGEGSKIVRKMRTHYLNGTYTFEYLKNERKNFRKPKNMEQPLYSRNFPLQRIKYLNHNLD